MRKIKFRAWWRDRAGNAFELIEDLEDRYITDLNASHLIVEQYTGLKDKNGQEVFEGDIVHCYPDADICYQKIVEWAEDKPTLGITNNSGGLILCTSAMHEIEIIGNIHENGDLLK